MGSSGPRRPVSGTGRPGGTHRRRAGLCLHVDVTDGQNALTGLRVAVLGPGGVGGLLAALLARAGAAVTCLAGATTAERLRADGIRVESGQFGDFTTSVEAAERLAEPVDHLRRRYPQAGVVPATIRVESTRTAPGLIQHGSPFVTVDLVAIPPLGQRVRRLADALEQTGVTVRVGDGEAAALWSKLNFLAPLALLTTAAQATAGEVRASRREDLVAIIGEVAAVARAEGAPADEDQGVAFFHGVPAGMRSSMQRDAAAGRPLELDAIGGAVVRSATRHGVDVPVTARYVDELRERHPGS